MAKYVVIYEMNENGEWVVSVPSLPDLTLRTTTIEAGAKKIERLIPLYIPAGEHFELVHRVL